MALLPNRTRGEIEDERVRKQAAVRSRPSFSEHVCSSELENTAIASFHFDTSRRLPSAGNVTCSSQSRYSRARARDSFDFDTSRENRVTTEDSERCFDTSVLQSPQQRLGKHESTTHDKLRARHNVSETSSFDGGRSALAE